MNKLLSFFSLFGSMSTLLCCALPVTLVSIGMGAAFASITASFPAIMWLTEKKDYLFMATALMLLISYVMMKRSKRLACPIDLNQRDACQASKEFSTKLYWLTVLIYSIGLFFSYILPIFFR